MILRDLAMFSLMLPRLTTRMNLTDTHTTTTALAAPGVREPAS
jgi:hypothetical protein